MNEMTGATVFSVGDKVSKVGGDYRFDGTVIGVFTKLSGVVTKENAKDQTYSDGGET